MNKHQLQTIRGQGIEIDTAVTADGRAIIWGIRGQGITEDAGTYTGTRDEAIAVLLSPLGLRAQDGRIVEDVHA